jgi:hypothetical protein
MKVILQHLKIGVLLSAIFILVFLFVTCDFLNNNQDFEPTGTSYTLNSNIELIRIQESNLNYNPTGFFSIDFICHSKSSSTETATLPAGLFFTCQNSKVQNLIIVKDFGVSVASAADTFTLGAFSVNEFKSLPGDSDFYSIGPVTDHPDLIRIINIVKTKLLNSSNVLTVQHAIYQVTSNDSLSSAMVESLNLIPDSLPAFIAQAKNH